jgi:alkylation response protein AidB-like acyl-CoA dehydrogenase
MAAFLRIKWQQSPEYAAGTSGIYPQSPLQRYFRDVQVLRHHAFGAETRYETVGQVYLGLPPDFPVLAF